MKTSRSILFRREDSQKNPLQRILQEFLRSISLQDRNDIETHKIDIDKIRNEFTVLVFYMQQNSQECFQDFKNEEERRRQYILLLEEIYMITSRFRTISGIYEELFVLFKQLCEPLIPKSATYPKVPIETFGEQQKPQKIRKVQASYLKIDPPKPEHEYFSQHPENNADTDLLWWYWKGWKTKAPALSADAFDVQKDTLVKRRKMVERNDFDGR
ncbi:hypothetical protein HK096_010239, partial [Nowakowskiella sp. JEL0078]